MLVVGAGPTGLVLGAQLLARGIQHPHHRQGLRPAPQSRALGIQARTLELLDVMGLAENFIDRGQQVRRFRMYAGGRNLFNLDMSRNGSRYGFILHLPATRDRDLAACSGAASSAAPIEDGVELVRLDRGWRPPSMRRCVIAAGRRVEIGADYVVGCDGAHSRVRHELGLAFDGQPYPQDWLLADVALDGLDRDDADTHLLPPGRAAARLHPDGQASLADRHGQRGRPRRRPPSLEEIQELVEQRAPRRRHGLRPGWLASFRCQLRSTTTYRRGRVLLAGDAAHIHSPAGGQGMNTGMMDAHNLAWKLALVAGGRAPDSLLDSYGQERMPVASNVLGVHRQDCRAFLTMRHPVKRAVRDTLLPTLTSLPAVQSRAARRLAQVSVAYPSSPLIQTDRVQRGLAPGHRVPDIEVRTEAGSTRLYEVLSRGRHVLLVSSVDVRIAIMAAGLKCHRDLIEVVDSRFIPLGRRARRVGSFALVRPDGILAVRGRGKNIDNLVSYLQQIAGSTHPARTTPAAVWSGRPTLAVSIQPAVSDCSSSVLPGTVQAFSRAHFQAPDVNRGWWK